ncbi:MAG TPA: hypothetical protein VNT01_11320, partial [Symbiobacteriaceae bacterium]|nr:hypothetical protein [Symbiobacteriaceae bacterium]
LVFYNYLWGGTRTGYLSMYGGHGLEALANGDMSPAYTRWISQFNNYIQAAQAFAALEETPGPVGEKALYSHALSLLKLERGYGEDVALWRREGEIYREAVAVLERLVREHPRSDLADDAMLSLGYLKQDESYFERINREYPGADAKPRR